MAKKPKALTRKITRKRALSYDRMSANGRGVTAMSEVNGEGAYAKRYARTRQMLDSKGKPVTKSSFVRSQMAKGRSKKQAEATWRMRQNAKGAQRPTSRKRTSSKRRKAPAKRTRRASGTKRASGTQRDMSPNFKRGGKRVLKRDFVAEQMAAGRTEKQAEATWRMLNKSRQKAKARAKKGRTYGGKKRQYKALKAKAGRGRNAKTKWTYLYETKRGNTRKIPDHALMGYSSAAKVAQIQRTGSEKEREQLARRTARLFERRARAAEKAEQHALQGKAWFSPNAGEDVQTFEEWSKMKRNARKRSKSRASSSKRPKSKAAFIKGQMAKGRTKKQAEATWRMTWGQRHKKKGRKSSTKRKTTRQKSAGKRRTTTKRRSTRSKSPAKRKRSSSKRSSSRVKRDSAGRRITPKRRAAARRNLKKACSSVRKMKANKRGSYSRKRKATTRKLKSYKSNASGAAYKTELMNSMKFGAIVLGGFLTHRLLTNLVDKHLTSKVEALSTGSMADWRKTISGALVAAVGIPLTVRMLPKHAGVAAAGMAASVLYEFILTGLKMAKQPELLEAVAAYPNAEGYPQYSGTGSYYTYDTHQVFDGTGGMGSYYETQYIPGLEQAAANGMGQEMLMQAAAGMGAPQLTQMYANPMGEYYATGAEGIGEYESYASEGGGDGGYIDDGIMPNMHSAEQMLDVAEAAAGVGAYDDTLAQAAAGFGDLPLQSTVTPNIRAMDIPGQPGGSRAGILQGNDGIFG